MARRTILFVSILVLFAVASPSPTASSIFTGYETRLTTDLGDQYDPSISGDIVVFTDFRGADADVYYVNLAEMSEHPVLVGPGNQQLTGVSDGVAVYTDYRTVDVVAFNTADGTTRNLTRADKELLGRNFNSVDPAISQGLVAWQDSRDGNMEIYATYLPTGEERRVTDSAAIDQRPSVSGSRIAFERCVPGGTCDVWMYDWSTGVTTQITNTPASNERTPSIDGTRIVYQGDRSGNNDIYCYDLVLGTERHLELAGDQANPHLSGDNVAMDDLSGGLYHIKLWHMPTNDVFQVTSGTSGQYLNDIDGNRIVYTDDRNGDLDIYMFTFAIETPHAYQFTGFASPVANQPVVNSVKAGSAVPLKWQLFDDTGADVSTLSAVSGITFHEVLDLGGTGPDIDAPATGNSGLRYDFDARQYVFTWKTDRTLAGRSIVVTIALDDGSRYSANFKLR